jgi:hypothetical protein
MGNPASVVYFFLALGFDLSNPAVLTPMFKIASVSWREFFVIHLSRPYNKRVNTARVGH